MINIVMNYIFYNVFYLGIDICINIFETYWTNAAGNMRSHTRTKTQSFLNVQVYKYRNQGRTLVDQYQIWNSFFYYLNFTFFDKETFG